MYEDGTPQVDPGASRAAQEWLAAVHSGDNDGAWAALDDTLTTSLTQLYLMHHEPGSDVSRESRCSALVVSPTHDLMKWAIEQLAAATTGVGADGVYHVGTFARPLGPEIEVVVIFPEGQVPSGVLQPGDSAWSLHLPVRRVGEDYRVAGVGWLVSPGWPPTFTPIDASVGG